MKTIVLLMFVKLVFASSCASQYVILKESRITCSLTFKLYLNEMKEMSSIDFIPGHKCLLVNKFQRVRQVKQMERSYLDKSNNFFKKNRYKIIKTWENQYTIQWPTCAEEEIHAHHIIPQIYGGPNVWWNLWPLTATKHRHQHCGETLCYRLFPDARGGGRTSRNKPLEELEKETVAVTLKTQEYVAL